MPALAQLRIDALLAVLIVTACVMSSLRGLVLWSNRAVAARDARAIAAIAAAARRTVADVPR